MVTTDEYTFKDCQTTLFGNPSFTTIKYHEKGQGQLRRRYDIQAYSQGVPKMVGPIMCRMMATWNERVWLEDLSLKLRRHKVLRWGFRDFVGFPDSVDDQQDVTWMHMRRWLPNLTRSRPVPSGTGTETESTLRPSPDRRLWSSTARCYLPVVCFTSQNPTMKAARPNPKIRGLGPRGPAIRIDSSSAAMPTSCSPRPM